MLTGLRGIAVLIVFVSHCANEGLLPGFMGNGLGQIGVVIFFVLSGFLIAYIYLDKLFDVHSVGRYIQARVARVVPLYLATIILSFVISNSVYPDFHYSITDPKILVRAFLFIDAPYEFWTIPVEMQFYGVFILFWFLYQLGVKKILLATFIVLTAVPSVIYLFLKGGTLVLFSTYSFAFFTGVITAILYDKIVSSPACRLFAKYSPVPLIILFVLNMPGLRFDYGWVLSDNLFARTWADPLNWVLVYGIFICAILNAPGFAFLNSKILAFYGQISYGFYLIHYPVIKLVKNLELAEPLLILLSLLLVTVLAMISYSSLEKVCGRAIKNANFTGLQFEYRYR